MTFRCLELETLFSLVGIGNLDIKHIATFFGSVGAFLCTTASIFIWRCKYIFTFLKIK
jgi:hypothetical protein